VGVLSSGHQEGSSDPVAELSAMPGGEKINPRQTGTNPLDTANIVIEFPRRRRSPATIVTDLPQSRFESGSGPAIFIPLLHLSSSSPSARPGQLKTRRIAEGASL
jgi:hypothetical protein